MEPVALDPYIVYMRPQGRCIKLHLGCGDYWFDGYLNIDLNIFGGTDMLLDIREKLPFQDDVVEIIEAHDVLEHFSQVELDEMLPDWQRVLIPGGKIIVSTPDIDALIKEYGQSTDQARRDEIIRYLYGYGGVQEHKWGYTKDSLKKLFDKFGFHNIEIQDNYLYSHRPIEPKLRLVCEK